MDFDQQLRLWADELHAIANDGLQRSADDAYHTRRYERIRRLAATIYAAQADVPASVVAEAYEDDSWHVSPVLGGDAAIFNQQGEILLIQRRDDALWAMPGGTLEVGETPAEGVCREAWEETGIAVRPVLLVGTYDSRRVGSRTQRHMIQFVFLCQPLHPESQAIVTEETLNSCYFAEDALPPLSPGHGPRIADAFRAWEGQRVEARFD